MSVMSHIVSKIQKWSWSR